MDHAACCDALEAEVERFVATIRDVDPATPVPTCPPWDLAKLARHLGTTHRWAERIVRDRAPQRIDPRTIDLALPADARGYPDWIARGGDQLVTTLRAVAPDTALWAWGADHHARFWSRRMLHESTVHRADAALATAKPFDAPVEVALDGIDELLENLPSAAVFSPNVARLRGDAETIHLHSTDADGEWMIELTPDGFTWAHGHGKGTVAVRGTALDLLLLAYGRYRPGDTRFTRFGDTDVLDHWIQNSALG